MSESNSGEDVSYQQVVSIAESIINSGHKVKVEQVRRQLGAGTHASIATHLRKWQKNYNKNHKINSKQQNNKNHKRNAKSHKYNHKQKLPPNLPSDDETYSPVVRPDPFNLETFMKESEIVKSLFLAICCVKQRRAKFVDDNQKTKAQTFEIQRQANAQIRRMKLEARQQVVQLSAQITKITLAQNSERSKIKDQL